jgi:hypothetical protein
MTEQTDNDVEALGVFEAISRGEWDCHLLRLDSLIKERMRTPAWLTHIVTTDVGRRK